MSNETNHGEATEAGATGAGGRGMSTFGRWLARAGWVALVAVCALVWSGLLPDCDADYPFVFDAAGTVVLFAAGWSMAVVAFALESEDT